LNDLAWLLSASFGQQFIQSRQVELVGFHYLLREEKVMKVFALGGYGKTGFEAIKLLATNNLITEIAIVGRNQKRAEDAV
jgi:hypothetical protein